jgi:pimeloyl-ACP methyl ester carboxylesterase
VTTLVLLPGLGCDAALFRDQAAALATDGPLVVGDVHARADALPAMAAALLARHPGPLALAGSSMGGMLALHAWRLAPGRVRALALLGSTARADTPAQRRLRRDGIALLEQGRLEDLLLANLGNVFHPAHAGALAADYLAMIRRAGALQLVAQNRAVMARADLRGELRRVACPTLVMVGADDRLTPPEASEEMAAAIPNAQFECLPECGHLPTWEQPGRVTAALQAWRRRWA